jgi:hypothetical protein
MHRFPHAGRSVSLGNLWDFQGKCERNGALLSRQRGHFSDKDW